MTSTRMGRRQVRLEKMFGECQQTVLSQIIGPFGLSTAMFKDKNGGNVTTVRNFGRADADYVATDDDKIRHAHAHRVYDPDVRAMYEVDTETKAVAAGTVTWDEKRQNRIKAGVDEYTGGHVNPDGTTQNAKGNDTRAELDHVKSIKSYHEDKATQLGSLDVKDGKVDTSRITAAVNDDKNLALTNKSLNGSKGAMGLDEWQQKEVNQEGTNAKRHKVDPARSQQKSKTADRHAKTTQRVNLLKKQGQELLSTGGEQAVRMGLRQAFGVLLTELVNGLFNEFKALVAAGVEAGKTLFEEITARLARIAESVAKKIPDALSQALEGGISGFISNLLTFLINNFVSTAKRVVTMIREGLTGLFRAFKMILFPPEGMTVGEALQAGLKVLTAVVVTSVGILLEEMVSGFVATIPVIGQLSGLITPVLIGIMTGLLTAFLAYKIDDVFDFFFNVDEEEALNALEANVQASDAFVARLLEQSQQSLMNVENYAQSARLYQRIGERFGQAASAGAATAASMRATLEQGKELINRTNRMLERSDTQSARIAGFLQQH